MPRRAPHAPLRRTSSLLLTLTPTRAGGTLRLFLATRRIGSARRACSPAAASLLGAIRTIAHRLSSMRTAMKCLWERARGLFSGLAGGSGASLLLLALSARPFLACRRLLAPRCRRTSRCLRGASGAPTHHKRLLLMGFRWLLCSGWRSSPPAAHL